MRFAIPGKPCSNNNVTRRVGNRSIKSAEARTYQARVNALAFAAAKLDGWKLTDEPCRVIIDAINVAIDIDNLPKVVLDGMNGVVYTDDKCVTELTLRKLRDDKGQRLIVTIEARQESFV